MEFSKLRLDPSFLCIPIAHRGLHDARRGIVENSRAAFQAAIDAGYAIECDVQFSKDDRPIIFHDYTLKRLTGKQGAVNAIDADTFTHIPLLGTQDCPQSLDAMLAQVAGKVPLLIEIKDPDFDFAPPSDARITAIVQAAQAYKGPLALMSFNPEFARALRKTLPNAAIGRTTDDFELQAWHFLPQFTRKTANQIAVEDFDFISHNAADLPRIDHLNIPKFCWTIRNEAQEKQARHIADNITFEGYLAEHPSNHAS